MGVLFRNFTAEKKRRISRFSYGLSGAIFFIGAYDGFTSSPPGSPLVLTTALISGAVQLGALIWSRKGEPPERLANAIASVGMLISAIGAMDHKSGIQYAYAAGGFLYAVVAWLGTARISRRRHLAPPKETHDCN